MKLFLPSDPRPLHFVGIAGAGMSALAMLALHRGVAVTGSDREAEGAPDLPGLGARVVSGCDPGLVEGARAVVVSAAIPADHPEVVRARALGIPVIPRKQAVAELVAGATVVAIAGTHGKTTTTAMATEALAAAGFDPTGLAGGRVPSWGGNARMGSDRLFVVEADEYDRAFLTLHPTVAVIGSVEPDHLECYGTVEELERAFMTFASRAATVLIGTADAGSERVTRGLREGGAVPERVWRFGEAAAELRVESVRLHPHGSTARLRLPEGGTVGLELRLPGLHNLLNAAAAVGVVAAVGRGKGGGAGGAGGAEAATAAASALARFGGVSRRFEVVGTAAGVTVVDDYAHHPTEVRATLAAARQAFPGRRLVAVFQPHLYSRTALLGVELGAALAAADVVVVTDIYAAREEPLPGVSGQAVAEAVRAARPGGGMEEGGEDSVRFVPDRRSLAQAVRAWVQPGDVVLTLGAGDITAVGRELVRRLQGT
jgi:UDP-N-acetylmuramate--alanine ligase